MEINIRKAIPEDAYNFAVCHISCWQSAYKNIVLHEYLENMSTEKEKRVENYKNKLANQGDCKYYCVMHAERMIGFIIINIRHNEDKSSIGEIWAIYLIEEFCGKNYGKKLLDYAINELKRMEPKEIILWVFEENHRARHFYEKNNFKNNGIKREVDWYGKPLVELQYVFNL
jgi:ribosomal protein S18 acetylase RimI-like enzyme